LKWRFFPKQTRTESWSPSPVCWRVKSSRGARLCNAQNISKKNLPIRNFLVKLEELKATKPKTKKTNWMKNTTKNQESEIGRLNRAIAELRTELDTASNRADVMFLRNEIRVLIYERDIAFHFSEEEFWILRPGGANTTHRGRDRPTRTI
jgi:hypothetical protein